MTAADGIDRTVLASAGYLDPLAEYLMLTGIKIGRGDLYLACQALGLAVRPAAELPDPGPGAGWPSVTAADAVLARLTEEDVCPKCGCPRRRLPAQPPGAGGGWWHHRDDVDFGYMRRCVDPGLRDIFEAGQ